VSHLPHVTVIVPTYNRPDELRRCLAALAEQDFARDRFDVIVADDGGAVSPAQVVAEAQSLLDITLLNLTHGGPARVRNRAAERARGEYLAFTDDDCRPEPGWLRALVATIERVPGALVGGRVTNALTDNRFSRASQTVTDLVYAHYNADADDARFFASNNLAIAADEFRKSGGFDERFIVLACEDREFCDRWRSQGKRMVYAENAVIRHAHALNLRTYMRQHFTYGRGALHFHRIRSERGSGRMRNEMSFHADIRNWLVRPFRGRPLVEGINVAALLLLWQTANTAGFFYESIVRSGYRR
jgi:GT2 family glycosyltransferase